VPAPATWVGPHSATYLCARQSSQEPDVQRCPGGLPHTTSGLRLLSPTLIVQPSAAALLERDRELARIEAAIARAREGAGATLIVEGPAGIGKSAVLNAARAAAEDDSATRVLRARGAELERDFAFGVVRQLFEPALREAGPEARAELLQGPAGLAARVLGLPGADGEAPAAAPDASFTILHGLYWLCANLAADGALVLAVDDAHWADTSSLRFLAFLLPRLQELPVALVVATRPEVEGEGAHLVSVLAADADADVVRLAPLTLTAVGRLIESGLGARPDRAFVEACHRATGGSPFLVRELIEALRVEGVEPGAQAAAQVEAAGARGARRWILLRMGRLPAPAVKLARALAVLESAELASAAALADLEPAAAAAAADALVASGILAPGTPLSFVHPLVRAGIYEELGGAERSLAHRRAAELLDGNPIEEERVAEHLLATQPAGDPWLARRLVEAARSAARRGAPESAAVLLRRALAEPAPPAERAQVLLELGIAEATAGQPIGEEHLEEALAHAGDDDGVRVGATLVLAHALGRAERSARAVAIVDRTAAQLRGNDEHVSAHLEVLALSAGMLNAGTAPALSDRLDAMRRRADDADAPREVLALAALRAVATNEPASVGIALARRAFAAGARPVPAPTDLPWFVQAAIALVWADALDEAQDRLDAGVAEARATGDCALFASSLALRAWLLQRRGDLQGAAGDARTVLDAADLPAPQLYRTVATAILVNSHLESGDVDAAEAALERFAENEPTRSQSGATLLLARGRVRAARRRMEAALADMLEAGRLALGTSAVAPGFLEWRSEAASVHAALGNRDAAVRLVREELALARAFGAERTLGVALRNAGAVIGGREGEELLREAVATLERAGVGLERARALVELGAHLRRANRRREARELLREGLDIAHRAGARPVADHAATELRATGAKPRRVPLTGVESLTASERRVAELAAQGLTNREIAQALFVTARTVEGHLTRTFQKLDLRSRDDLAGAL
jgi:DNA-binding CsgD family transcriptional regulator